MEMGDWPSYTVAVCTWVRLWEHFQFVRKFSEVLFIYRCFAYMSVCVPYVYLVSMEARRGHWIPGTGVTDGCELLCGSWDLNMSLLEVQPVLLTAEPSLLPQIFFF